MGTRAQLTPKPPGPRAPGLQGRSHHSPHSSRRQRFSPQTCRGVGRSVSCSRETGPCWLWWPHQAPSGPIRPPAHKGGPPWPSSDLQHLSTLARPDCPWLCHDFLERLCRRQGWGGLGLGAPGGHCSRGQSPLWGPNGFLYWETRLALDQPPGPPALTPRDPQTVTQTTAGWEKTKRNSRIGHIKMFRRGSRPCGSEVHHLCPARSAARLLRRHRWLMFVDAAGGSGWATVRCPAALGTQTGPAGCLPLLSSPVSTGTFCLGSHTVHPPEGHGQAWAGLPLGPPRPAPPLPLAHRGLWLGLLSFCHLFHCLGLVFFQWISLVDLTHFSPRQGEAFQPLVRAGALVSMASRAHPWLGLAGWFSVAARLLSLWKPHQASVCLSAHLSIVRPSTYSLLSEIGSVPALRWVWKSRGSGAWRPPAGAASPAESMDLGLRWFCAGETWPGETSSQEGDVFSRGLTEAGSLGCWFLWRIRLLSS